MKKYDHIRINDLKKLSKEELGGFVSYCKFLGIGIPGYFYNDLKGFHDQDSCFWINRNHRLAGTYASKHYHTVTLEDLKKMASLGLYNADE